MVPLSEAGDLVEFPCQLKTKQTILLCVHPNSGTKQTQIYIKQGRSKQTAKRWDCDTSKKEDFKVGYLSATGDITTRGSTKMV